LSETKVFSRKISDWYSSKKLNIVIRKILAKRFKTIHLEFLVPKNFTLDPPKGHISLKIGYNAMMTDELDKYFKNCS